MKSKYTIILFILSTLLMVIGTVFRLQHWPYGKEILTIGIFLLTISCIGIAFKIFRPDNTDDHSNS